MHYGCLTETPFRGNEGFADLKIKMTLAGRLRKQSTSTSQSTFRKNNNHSQQTSEFSRKNSLRASTSKQPWRTISRRQTLSNFQQQTKNDKQSQIQKIGSRNFRQILKSRTNKNIENYHRKQLIFTAKQKQEQVGFNMMCKLLGVFNGKAVKSCIFS